MFSDHFAPGIAGLVIGVPVAFAVLVALVIFHRPLIRFAFSVRAWFARLFASAEQEIQAGQETAHREREP